MFQFGARHSISWIVEFGGQILSGSLAEQSDFGSVKLAFVLDIRLVSIFPAIVMVIILIKNCLSELFALYFYYLII